MRTFTVAIGLIGVFASHAAFAQEPAAGTAPPATQPPPAETPPPAPTVAAPGRPGAPTPFGAAGPTGASLWGVLPWGGYGMGARHMMAPPITPPLPPPKVRHYLGPEFRAGLPSFHY